MPGMDTLVQMLTQMFVQNFTPAMIIAIAIGLVRAITGWLENALKDGVIEDWEWKQLLGTVAKYFGAVFTLMIGLPVEQSVVAAFSLDIVQSALKKHNEVYEGPDELSGGPAGG